MTIVNQSASESWDAVYSSFQQINFTSFTYDVIKESLLQHIQIYYPEHYNDWIESSSLIAIIETFAYAAELLAYRTDVVAHENFISTAQRKQSILRLAKLISYSAARNIPARGLVKINSIKSDEIIYDSLGNNLAGITINWNDPNNSNWKEQFFLVMNLVLTTNYGQPSKSFQVADVLMQLYTLNNNPRTFNNGVFSFSATSSTSTISMEAAPIDIDKNGPKERAPDANAQFSIVYASDGRGDSSDYTGFLMFVKQGTLILTEYTIDEAIANRRIVLNQSNVNDTDVWLYQVDNAGSISQVWNSVPAVADQTLSYNNLDTVNNYEIETLENDQIALLFGDGNFSTIPIGKFQLWTRVSTNQNITVAKNAVVDQAMSFIYTNLQNQSRTCSLTFSLTSALQNNAPSETIEHVRQAAPATYYAQNRMTNAQDYNTFMLKDSTILKLNTINRTFAGQPKYIEWNDASGAYQNIKLFGDDLTMRLKTQVDIVQTTSAARGLIDTFIEPALSTNAILNTLTHQLTNALDYVDGTSGQGSYAGHGIISYPRRKFIEDSRSIYKDINGDPVNPYGIQLDGNPLEVGNGSLMEKTAIQGALDGHWYGDPITTVTINGALHGVIPDPILNPESNGKLYVSNLPRTIDGINTYPPGDQGSGLQAIQRQKYFGLKYNRFLAMFGNGTINLFNPSIPGSSGAGLGPAPAEGLSTFNYKVETFTIQMLSDGSTFTVTSNLRGKMSNYSLTRAASTANGRWSEQVTGVVPVDFAITAGSTLFDEGDAFVIDTTFDQDGISTSSVRLFGANDAAGVNLSGWWQLIPSDVVTASESDGGLGLFSAGSDNGPNQIQQLVFDQSTLGSSWVFLISRTDDSSGNVQSWSIYNRDMKIIASSPSTKFWFNQNSQIVDSETLKPLYDKIRILRSNIDAYGQPVKVADIYDCVGFSYDSNGEIISNELELLPTDTINFTQSGDGSPDNILQFENFAQGAYQYTLFNVSGPTPILVSNLDCDGYSQLTGYDIDPYDTSGYDTTILTITDYINIGVTGFSEPFVFGAGNFLSSKVDGYQLTRQLFVPAPALIDPVTNSYGCNIIKGLDFMWQHYTPDSNLIDPSVSNIHDSFILTQGYYNSVMNYVNGLTNIIPSQPTPLDLRTSYGYLLENKMLSDTVVLHSGKIKLLFGALADQTVRAKFNVVISPTATLSPERIKQEVISTINSYFNISNWNFGATFYATRLIALIHQALSTQISSVVIVPTYSVNSFGSLFTIDAGFDEVLQSCATVNDVQIVTALTPSALRQNV